MNGGKRFSDQSVLLLLQIRFSALALSLARTAIGVEKYLTLRLRAFGTTLWANGYPNQFIALVSVDFTIKLRLAMIVLSRCSHAQRGNPIWFFLPYAAALDLGNAWAQRFAEALTPLQMQQAQPTWYVGNNFNAFTFVWGFTSFSRGLSSAISSSSVAPGSSGGGFGGSGGGGDGGGGGGR